MHNELDKKGNLIFLDNRARKLLKPFLNAKIKFFKKNLFRNVFVFKERLKCYLIFKTDLKRGNKRGTIEEYYINGIPPFIRFPISQNKVFILFQNKNLFSYLNYFNKNLSFKFKFIVYHLIHFFLINLFIKNTDTLIAQTNSMKETIKSIKTKNKVIVRDSYWKNLTLKFYEDNILYENDKSSNNIFLKKIKEISKINKIFFYPSSFEPHKNHKILFKAFEKLSFNSKKNIKLVVTVDANEVPKQYRNNEFILFIGKQPLNVINQIYRIVDFLIFPSLNESLGLPLIEASLFNLPIIAANLDYVYDVCKPKITFNPISIEDIYQKINDYLN